MVQCKFSPTFKKHKKLNSNKSRREAEAFVAVGAPGYMATFLFIFKV
jgi:hypothetical protein